MAIDDKDREEITTIVITVVDQQFERRDKKNTEIINTLATEYTKGIQEIPQMKLDIAVTKEGVNWLKEFFVQNGNEHIALFNQKEEKKKFHIERKHALAALLVMLVLSIPSWINLFAHPK